MITLNTYIPREKVIFSGEPQALDRLNLFMNPRTVAIVGASRESGPGRFNLIENLRGFGYVGKILPVNPQADEILV